MIDFDGASYLLMVVYVAIVTSGKERLRLHKKWFVRLEALLSPPHVSEELCLAYLNILPGTGIGRVVRWANKEV